MLPAHGGESHLNPIENYWYSLCFPMPHPLPAEGEEAKQMRMAHLDAVPGSRKVVAEKTFDHFRRIMVEKPYRSPAYMSAI